MFPGDPRRYFALAAVLGFVAACTLAGCSSGTAGSSSESSVPVTPNQPLTNGKRVSLARAQAGVAFRFAVPDSAAANSGNLTSVWLDRRSDIAAMVFGGGDIAVMMSRWAYKEDPAQRFATFIAQNDATVNLARVDGNVTLVIAPHTDADHSNPAWVEVDLHGVDVNIVSLHESTATLLDVATNMAKQQQTNCATCTAEG